MSSGNRRGNRAGIIIPSNNGETSVYYYWGSKEQCYLVYAYAKNVAADLTRDQLRRLAAMIAAEVGDERKTV